MLTELCAELKNYFEKEKFLGTFQIVGGELTPSDFLKEGQYFRIIGSTFNDGVYQAPTSCLIDETFNAAVWTMAVPRSVIALAEEIKSYNESDEAKPTVYTSESFGGYSYSKATDSNGMPLTWQKVFANQLKRYRKI